MIMAAAAALEGNSDLDFPFRIDRVTSNLLRLLKNCRGIKEGLLVFGVGTLWPKRDDESKGFVVEEEEEAIVRTDWGLFGRKENCNLQFWEFKLFKIMGFMGVLSLFFSFFF